MELQEFIEKFAEIIEVDNVEALTPQTDFKELDEWSSLSAMMIIAFLDEEFNKQINATTIRSCSTILDLYNFAVS